MHSATLQSGRRVADGYAAFAHVALLCRASCTRCMKQKKGMEKSLLCGVIAGGAVPHKQHVIAAISQSSPCAGCLVCSGDRSKRPQQQTNKQFSARNRLQQTLQAYLSAASILLRCTSRCPSSCPSRYSRFLLSSRQISSQNPMCGSQQCSKIATLWPVLLDQYLMR